MTRYTIKTNTEDGEFMKVYSGEHLCLHTAFKARQNGAQVRWISEGNKGITVAIGNLTELTISDRALWVGRPSFVPEAELEVVYQKEVTNA